MAERLSGRVALVTGATGGIGEAIVRRLAGEGATAIVTDIDVQACTSLAAGLPGTVPRALPFALDVTDEERWQLVVARVVADCGGLHILVNNAGIARITTVESETLDSWHEVVSVGQLGVWLGMKHSGPAIEAAGGGSIVNMCSIFGTVGGFGTSFSYHAAKGAVRVMTKNAALHWATSGVRVNSVHPGFIEHANMRSRWQGTPRYDAMLEGTPMQRLGRPEDVAGAVAFLASDDAAFMTGSELYVDGGWTAR